MLKKRVLENPQILGWLGILPFIFTSFFVLFEIRFSLELKVLGLLYASSILGFLGAVYWGYLLKSEAHGHCLLYTSPSPRDRTRSRMPSSA